MSHFCDPTVPHSAHNPLTLSRSMRLLLASLDDTTDPRTAATPVLGDLGSCTKCLSTTLVSMAGIAAAALLTDAVTRSDAVAGVHAQLAQLLDELSGA